MPLIIMRYKLSFKATGEDEFEYFDLGGYTFKIKGMEIPFDFSAYEYDMDYDEDNGRICIDFESGRGAISNEYEIDECYDNEYKNLQLDKNAITAEFLSKVDEILEIYIDYNYVFEINKLEDIKFEDITFEDLTTGKIYSVDSNVAKQFNKKIQLELAKEAED